MADYAAARLNMVEGQLRTNRISDPALLQAFLTVPRERFVPEELRGTAHVDKDVPIGRGRYLMAPLVLARLIQLAETEPGGRALFVGAGTGYGPAILGQVTRSVVALESDPAYAASARAALAELGCRNVSVVEGPLEAGHVAGAPYDSIIFGGAIADLSEAVQRQCHEHGRMVAVVQPARGMGQLMVMTRVGPTVSRRPSFDAATALLPGFAPQPGFVF